MKHSYYEIKVWFLPVLCVGIAFLHGLFLYSASSSMDDVYITYWVAKTLSNFGTIINYNGEVLEQSSSLLHVIILAVLHRLSGISLPNLGIYFSALMGGLTMLAAWRLACFLKVRSAWFVVLFCAWFPYLVYWSFTGLEDDGGISGIKQDIEIASKRHDKDGFVQTITNAINDNIGAIFTEKYILVQFETVDDKEICVIKVTKSKEPAFLTKNGKSLFFIRNSHTTRELDTREVIGRFFTSTNDGTKELDTQEVKESWDKNPEQFLFNNSSSIELPF
jgi:hypothetical protein